MRRLRRGGRGGGRVAESLAQATTLEEQGRCLEAVELLTEANRVAPAPALDVRLVKLRNKAFAELGTPGSAYAEPASVQAEIDPDGAGLPGVAAAELTAATIRRAFLEFGCLIVRGLVPEENAARLQSGIDRTFAGRDAALEGAPVQETTPWYHPFQPAPEYRDSVAHGRGFVGKGSGIWTADSPRLTFELLETFEQAGVRRIVSEYLGERPAISVNKGTLRRAAPKVGTEWWHQDGAFLGSEIRSMNIWLSLNHSGVDAPGLEVVPKRLETIVEKGTEGADFDWSVGEPVVERVSGGVLARPVFRPGDALLFDHLCLHRTGSDASMTKTRYATETWFFAPSAYPDPQQQVPLAF